MGATIGSSSYSDSSSSELDSTSEELVSVGVGDLIELGTSSLRIATRLTTCFDTGVLLNFFVRIFDSFGARFLFTIGRGGVSSAALAYIRWGPNNLTKAMRKD